MRSLRILLVLFAVLFLISTPLQTLAQGKGPDPVGLRPDAPDYAKHGPFWVGTREFTIPDKNGKRPLPLTVWYPALNPDGKVEAVNYVYENFATIKGFTLQGHALKDAALDTSKGPYPLVILSHGLVNYRYTLAYLGEHLASHGFVVMAIDHTGDTLAYGLDPKLAGVNGSGLAQALATAAIFRPADIQRTINYAKSVNLQGGDLAGFIDIEHIAVVGHSYGGYTALVSAGAQVNFSPWVPWCAENAANRAVTSNAGYMFLCQILLPSEARLLAMRGSTSKLRELWPPFDVTGVDAIVPISPAAFFAPDSFEHVVVPTLLMVGTNDYFPRFFEGAGMAYEKLSSDRKGLVVFENADHNFPVFTCTSWFIEHDAQGSCGNDSVWDMDRAHDLINHFTTAFLLDVLKGDKDAHKALLPDAVKFAGIEYKTTMK